MKKNSQMDFNIIDLTPDTIADYGVCGYKDVNKHVELQRKIAWFKKYYQLGLRIKILFSDEGGYQGMLEYIPGTYAHRPVKAAGYMFIHCIFVGFKKIYKGKGYASFLIDECIKDAYDQQMKGVAVVTRKGPFMARKDIFLKKNFTIVDTARPDFDLLVFKFDQSADDPRFLSFNLNSFSDGLYIIRSAQCPYSVKNVDVIIKTAIDLDLQPELIELEDSVAAQQSPCAFGTFCIVYNGSVVSHHPISNTRFENIMKKILTK